jgi:hypothetical protein
LAAVVAAASEPECAVEARLSLTSIGISLGLIIGTWASGVWFGFFWLTRSYRRVRNRLVIGLGYLVLGLSTLGPLLVFLRSLERMNIRHDTIQAHAATGAYTIGFASMAALTFWSEVRWRKSVGLWKKKPVHPHRQSN